MPGTGATDFTRIKRLSTETINDEPIGQPVVLFSRDSRRKPVRGRLVAVDHTSVTLDLSDDTQRTLRRAQFDQYLIGHFARDDQVLKRGVPESEWRGIVVDPAVGGDPERIQCWICEGSPKVFDHKVIDAKFLEHIDDRDAAAARRDPLKPGRVARDPAVEEINQEAYAARYREEATG